MSALASLDEPLYALGYARISGSKEQKDSALSIPAQYGHLDAAMATEGAIVVDRADDVLRGTRSDRPGYQRVLAIARRLRQEGKRVAVFVVRLDRFGRDTEERGRAWKELAKLDVRLYAVKQGGWVTDRFYYELDAALARREVDMIGARIRDVNEFVRRNGYPVIGRVAWGYAIRAATPEERAGGSGKKMLQPHPLEAAAVRRVWEMRASGASLGDVHRYVLSLTDDETGGRSLDRATFRRMFDAAVYVGRHDYPKGHALAATPVLERVRGKWEPLISDETYRRAREQREEHRRRPKQSSGHYLLTGVLRCDRCGGRMVGTSYRAREQRADGSVRERAQQRYQCVSSIRGRKWTGPLTLCSTVIVASALDDAVRAEVERVVEGLHAPERRAALQRLWDDLRRGRRGQLGDELAAQIARAERQRATWTDARASAYPDLKAGILTQREYDEIRARATGEIDAAERELDRLRARLEAEGQAPDRAFPPLAVVLARLEQWGALVAGESTPARRALLGELIERVEPVRLARGRYRVAITWTARGTALDRVTEALDAQAQGRESGCVLSSLLELTLQHTPGTLFESLPLAL